MSGCSACDLCVLTAKNVIRQIDKDSRASEATADLVSGVAAPAESYRVSPKMWRGKVAGVYISQSGGEAEGME